MRFLFTVASYNAALVKWFDRLFNTGYVTCAVKKPFEALGKTFESEFTTCIYDLGRVDFLESVSDFFQTVSTSALVS